ncbi:MAG: CoA transferase [Betaproteobacteria bacterium]|jgi:formyl-CoA transferase|nr:CoA transferase [Betaproteobacteria bacterium]
MPHTPASPALARFRVLDLTRVRAGPTCVKQLADFGADVIKIELPPSVEVDTMSGPRHGFDMQNLHRNKRSMTLNLKVSEGREIFMQLVARADVVVENFRPDVKDRLGIGYAALKRVNPRIVLASISGFGQDGPYAGRPGFDQIAQGMGGLMAVTGEPGRGPMRAGTAVADLAAGIYAACGVLTALLEREVSGEGQWVQSNLLQAQIGLMDFQAARFLVTGDVPRQAGNDHPHSMPTSAYRTKDGYLNVGASGQVIFRRFCEAIGKREWADRPEFADEAARSANRAQLNAEIGRILASKTTAEWSAILNEAGVPSGPIYSMDQVFTDPQVQHLGAAAAVKHSTLGEIRIVNQVVKLSRTPAAVVQATPEIGEHTDELLAELGFTAEDLAGLRERRVI